MVSNGAITGPRNPCGFHSIWVVEDEKRINGQSIIKSQANQRGTGRESPATELVNWTGSVVLGQLMTVYEAVKIRFGR